MTSALGAVLRDARTRARLSQTDVARRSDVSQSVISAAEQPDAVKVTMPLPAARAKVTLTEMVYVEV
jgi:transcriptional regulator with XRE-family HTH domain